MLNDWLINAHNWLMPPVCVLCGQAGQRNRDLCAGCEAELPYITTACRNCAIPLPHEAVCGQCQQHPPAYDAAYALMQYAEPVDFLIQRLKFNGKLYNARLLGQLMAQHWPQQVPRPDAVIPVPLHSSRLRQRGFNQALELARPVAAALRLPLLSNLCHRQHKTPTQTGLDARARRRNLKDAFVVEGLAGLKHLAIVDDVMTTGTTAEIMARTLKQAGAERVDVWVFARAALSSHR